jgi:C-terminal processing protease CtpA/Prc
MKNILLLCTVFITTISNGYGLNSAKVQQLGGLCRVWGYLKYYHPQIQKGKIDWDSTLIATIPKVFDVTNNEEYNKIINQLILSAGRVEKLSTPFQYLPKDTSYNNFDYSWINNEKLFTKDNSKLLFEIIENYKPRKNIYIQNEINKYYFDEGGENKFKEYYYENNYNPDTAHALLAYFRYWNVINYFFGYKKIMDENWNDVLPEFLPKILESANNSRFYLTMVHLTTKINDCHAFFKNYNYDSLMGKYYIPIEFRFIENKTIVTGIPDTLSLITGMKKGDAVIKINSIDIAEKRKEMGEYCGCATSASVEREINYGIRKSLTKEFSITFSDSTEQIKTVTFPQGEYWHSYVRPPATQSISDSIGYINLSLLESMGSIGKAINRFRNKKAIVFDLRDNAWTALLPIGLRLPNRKGIPFSNYYEGSFKYPASFKFTKDKDWYLGLRAFHKKYKGKVIFLINENVQSSYEWQLMSLKTDFKIILVGSNTSGTDGSATSFLIQKNFLTYFTRDAVFFSDGSPTQRIGIKPDIYVLPTIMGIREGKDEVIERAVKFINTGN